MRPTLSNQSGFGSNVNLRLDSIRSNGTDASYQNYASPSIASPSLISPSNSFIASPGYDKNKNIINYDVYPQEVQDLVKEYNELCSNLHGLGLLLSDYLRHADAKREYNRALGIFRKLKIKPQLYEDILTDIRTIQRAAASSGSSKSRAQNLAKRTPTSRSRAPQTPSFSFSFSNDNYHKMHGISSDISPFILATAK